MLWRTGLLLFSAAMFLAMTWSSNLSATTTPVVYLTSPGLVQSNGSFNVISYYGNGPLHLVGYAVSPDCVGGISAMLIYPANFQIAYQTDSSYLDFQLPLAPAFYEVDIKAFDNCGGVADVWVYSYIQNSSGTVTVNSPEANLNYASPVYFSASGTTTCASGISAMGIYTANHQLAYSVNGSTLSTTLSLAPGTYNLAIQEWDNCGSAANTLETITVSPQGIPSTPQFVYMPRTGAPWIDGFWINPTSCALSTAPGSPFPAHYKPWGTAADPLGVFVFALNKDSADVNAYTIDQNTGGLTQTTASPVQVPESGSYSPTSVIADAKGRFLYVALGSVGQAGEIAAFAVDRSTGKLTLVPGSPFSMKNDAAGTVSANFMVAEQSGKYLYTSNASSVSGFSINQTTGALTEFSNSPYNAPGRNVKYAGTEDIITDPADHHVYTANGGDNSVSGWAISASNGELTALPGSPWIDPTIPSGVAFSPASITIDAKGNYLFGLDAGAEQISIWSVDASTGTVVFLRDEHNGQIVPDPLDKMRVVPGSNCMVTSEAYAVSFDPATGATTIVPGSPFALPGSGQEPGIAIAP